MMHSLNKIHCEILGQVDCPLVLRRLVIKRVRAATEFFQRKLSVGRRETPSLVIFIVEWGAETEIRGDQTRGAILFPVKFEIFQGAVSIEEERRVYAEMVYDALCEMYADDSEFLAIVSGVFSEFRSLKFQNRWVVASREVKQSLVRIELEAHHDLESFSLSLNISNAIGVENIVVMEEFPCLYFYSWALGKLSVVCDEIRLYSKSRKIMFSCKLSEVVPV